MAVKLKEPPLTAFLWECLKGVLLALLCFGGPFAMLIVWVNYDRLTAEKFVVERGQYSAVIRGTLKKYNTPEACLESLKITYASMFSKAKSRYSEPPSLGELLNDHYKSDMQLRGARGEKDREPEDQIDKLLEVINLQRAEEPYAGLPYSDRELLIDIKEKLTTLDPDIAKPLISHLTAVLREKDDEAKRYQSETSTANTISRYSLLATILALVLTAISFKWAYDLRSKAPPADKAKGEPGV